MHHLTKNSYLRASMDISTSKLEGLYYVAVPPEESLKKKFRRIFTTMKIQLDKETRESGNSCNPL